MNSNPITISPRHPLTQKVVDVLVRLKDGETIAYAEIATRCGATVAQLKQRVAAARNAALREHVVIDTVINVGLVRLSQDDVPAPVGRQRARARSAARRGLKLIRQGVTDWGKLSDGTRSALLVETAVFGAVALATSTAGRARLEEGAKKESGELSIGRTLELLR